MSYGYTGNHSFPPAPAPPKDAPPVQSSIGRLTRQVGELSDLIEKLGERLSPVLAPPAPMADSGCNQVERGPDCEIESDIRTEAYRVEGLINRLANIYGRLQV